MASTETEKLDGAVTGEVRLLIDGELTEAESGKRFDNINPATEEVLGQVADASVADMGKAIAAARRAFDETDWSTNRAFRRRCLEQLQAAIESEREEYRAELVAEVGTPIMLTYGPQLDAPLEDGLLWPARVHRPVRMGARSCPIGHAFGGNAARTVVKEAAGVVGAIVPWNYPLEVTLQKVGQALATGNTMILKPAPDTPWNATRLGRLVAERTDIPAGVFNVIASSDHLVGEELVIDPRVDLISFTGSTVTGKRIMEKGAQTMKRLFLELGGKSADIVLDDADFEAKLLSVAGVCAHGGQGCVMPTRLMIPRARLRRRRSSSPPRGSATFPTAIPPTWATSRGRRSARSSASGCSATSRRARTKAPVSSSAVDGRRTSTRAASWSPRCSPTSTTR